MVEKYGFPDGSVGEESVCYVGDLDLIPGLRRWKWQPTPAFLPGELHGWSSLVGYSPWGSQKVEHD